MPRPFIPHKARATPQERRQLAVLGLLAIYEGLVAVLSLGYLSVDCRSWYLFDVLE